MRPKTSIVTVTFNSREGLRKYIESIDVEARETPLDVTVVDNASSDGTVELLRVEAKRPFLKIIANEVNLGFARSSNMGATASVGQYLLFLNPDTAVKPTAIRKLTNFLDEHPEAGVVAPKILNEDGSLQFSCRDEPRILFAVLEAFRLWRLSPGLFGGYRYASWHHNTTRAVGWVSGACLMIRKSLFEEIGGFDESFFLYYEDTDLCLRVRRKGFSVYYLPEALVIHTKGASSKTARESVVLNDCLSALYFFRKLNGRWSCLFLRLALFASSVAKGIMAYVLSLIRLDRNYRVIGQSYLHTAAHLACFRSLRAFPNCR